MGLNYSADYQVPREGVFDFLSAANELCNGRATSLLHWPDGRHMLFRGYEIGYRGPQPQHLAMDGSFDRASLCTSLLFEPDDVLSNAEHGYHHSDDGRYAIGCLYLRARMSPWTWLDEEVDQVEISFHCATTHMSRDIAASPSAKHTFTNLARFGGALSCFFDSEGDNDRIWFADREEMDVAASNYRPLPLTEALSKVRSCASVRSPLSGHDLMARFDWARNESDSGVRGAACASLKKERSPEVDELLRDRLKHDSDWRVRFVAARTLGERPGQANDEALFSALHDSNWDVVISAIHALKSYEYKERPISHVADEIATLVATLPFFGPSMGAFLSAMKKLAQTSQHSHAKIHSEIIQRRMSEPEFPFTEEAQKAIERLEVWSEKSPLK